jgi:hypothetical protein
MPDKGMVSLEFDGDDVEAARRFDQIGMFGQVAESDFPDLAALDRGDRLLGITPLGIGPGFDLKEDQGWAVPGDDIDFPAAETITAGDEAIPFPEKVADGGFLAAAA